MAYPTNPIYKLTKNYFTNEVDGVITQVENTLKSIPFDQAHTDYQEYLEWVAEGNTAESAD